MQDDRELRPLGAPISKKQPMGFRRGLRVAMAVSLTLPLLGCGTMIFHNGTHTAQLLAANTTTHPLMPKDASPLIDAAPADAVAFIFEHEVKTSENIFHYLSGQSTSAILLSDWCSPQQWQAIKTEQSAVDMIVRWIASPLYAINSLSLSCNTPEAGAPAHKEHGPDLVNHRLNAIAQSN